MLMLVYSAARMSEEEGINALCLLIGQCVAESLGRGIDWQEKIDLWLLQVNMIYFPSK